MDLVGQENCLNYQLPIACLQAEDPFLGDPKHTNNWSDSSIKRTSKYTAPKPLLFKAFEAYLGLLTHALYTNR